MRQTYGRWFRGYVCLVALFLFYVGLDAVRHHDRWAMGDWLINYSGGFVRRGLSGSVSLYLSRSPLHLSMYASTFGLQLTCYATMFATVLYLVRSLRWSFWMMCASYSPATVSFPLFEPTFAFRKEILFLAFLGVLIVALDKSALSRVTIAVLLVPSMAALVLCHEAMLLYFPYLLCALIIATNDIAKSLAISAGGLLAGCLAFVSSVRHPGDLRTVLAICSSLGEHDLAAEPCSGAIIYMTRSVSLAHQDVLTNIAYWHLKLVMPFLLLMALLPVALGLIALWQHHRERYRWYALVICSAAAWIATVPLFVYAFDWNRWIYIHVFSLFLLMLFLERRWQASVLVEQQAIFSVNGRVSYVAVAVFLLSSLGWQLGMYHHFPLPGETLMVYLQRRVKDQPLHGKLNWRPPGT